MRLTTCALAGAVLVAAVGSGVAAPDDAAPPAKKAVESGVMWALRWLKNHQTPDGHWDAKSYADQCKLNRCGGESDAPHAVRSTALALLAFLGAGETPDRGSYRDCVKSGLLWLKAAQDAQGAFAAKEEASPIAAHAIATLVLSEAGGIAGDADVKAAARKGVDALLAGPALAGPWQKDFAKDGAVDVAALPWVVFALKSAETVGVAPDPAALGRVVAWFEARTDAKTGAVTDPATGKPDDALTAAGVLARAMSGRDAKKDPAIAAGGAALAAHPPAWEAATSATDPVAWHVETLATFIAGGDAWARWGAAMKTMLVRRQRMEADRDERGSWDPVGAAVKGGGRMETTAVLCLALQCCLH